MCAPDPDSSDTDFSSAGAGHAVWTEGSGSQLASSADSEAAVLAVRAANIMVY